MPALLRVEGLSKEIGHSDILVDINFEIRENEILGLIGPNGAGKTTLMECLAGSATADRWQVLHR